MANFNSNPRGGLTVDRDSLHASDGYKRQIAAMELMKESEMAEKMTCTQCGMPCDAGEYHPYAACLMFTACHNSETVRANLAQPAQAVDCCACEGRPASGNSPCHVCGKSAQAVDVGAVREVAYAIQQHRGDKALYRALAEKLTRAIGNAQADD